MKITGRQVEEVEIEIDDYDIKNIVDRSELPIDVYLTKAKRIYIKKLFPDLFDVYLDNDSKWCYDTDYHTSHSWHDTTIVREATVDEIETMKMFADIAHLVFKQELTL